MIRCACCGTKHNITVDHIKPKSFGGDKKWKQYLCFNCNIAKGILTIDYRTKTFYIENWMLSLSRKDFNRLMYKTHNFSCDYNNPCSKLYHKYHEV